jgi:hypothetical protein
MHPALRMLLLTPALAGWAAADLPRKAPIMKYNGLWTNSPFTSKPPPPEQGPAVNPLEDYVLGGVSPISSGYRVTLLNKKKPEERIVVDSDKPSGGFKILNVSRKIGDPLGTIVRLASGSVTGSVSFDTALLKLTPSPAAQPPQPNVPPGLPPGAQPQPGQPVVRQPRPRVVQPPPILAPQSNPQQPATPRQPSQRPDRRR